MGRVARSIARLAAVFALLSAAVVTTSSPADAQPPKSRGSFFVYTTSNCTGDGNASTVAPPFSIGGRNYPPNEPMLLFVTYQSTGQRFGPLEFSTDPNGRFCLLVTRAIPPGTWKIDIEQPGPGFTDSKVINVLPSETTTTTTVPPTTTTLPTETTTTLPTETTTSPTSTVEPPPVTTAAPPTSLPATSTTIPRADFPWEIVLVPVPPDPPLPRTGGSTTPVLLAIMLTLVGLGAVCWSRRATARRPKPAGEA